MNIAVLFYGQPRFLEFTKQRFLEEYNIPGCNVDFFIHFWKDIGYCPDQDINSQYDVNPTLEEDVNYLNPKEYSITNYSSLDDLTYIIKNTCDFFLSGKIKTKKLHSKSRYLFGQHLSLKMAYNLMETYEEKNNIKYDRVIKARSDFIFKDNNFYKNIDKYNTAKIEYYGLNHSESEINSVYTVALAKQHYNSNKEKWELQRIDKYDPNNEVLHDKYNTLRCGDVSNSCSREAARYFFDNWFETYTETLIKDVRNNNPTPLQLHRRHDSLQGEIILNNKITAYRIKRGRLHRVAYENNIRDKWQNHDLILLDKNSKNKVQDINDKMISLIP
jgi:hypothetical protein